MKRRLFIKLSVGTSALGSSIMAGASPLAMNFGKHPGTFLFRSCGNGTRDEEFLQKMDSFLAPVDPEWRTNMSVDNQIEDTPIIARIPGGQTTEVEVWTTRWLEHAQAMLEDEECYPVSGGWWSVNGDWNPTRLKVRNHLFHSPNHEEAEFEDWYLDQLSYEELQSLHSDHHREMIDRGEVHWDKVNVECPSN